MVVAVPVVRTKFPDPAFRVRAEAPVADPNVTSIAAAASAILTVLAPDPVLAILIASVVASAPKEIAVPPVAHVPPAVNVIVVPPIVVKTAAAGVVPPIALAAAK